MLLASKHMRRFLPSQLNLDDRWNLIFSYLEKDFKVLAIQIVWSGKTITRPKSSVLSTNWSNLLFFFLLDFWENRAWTQKSTQTTRINEHSAKRRKKGSRQKMKLFLRIDEAQEMDIMHTLMPNTVFHFQMICLIFRKIFWKMPTSSQIGWFMSIRFLGSLGWVLNQKYSFFALIEFDDFFKKVWEETGFLNHPKDVVHSKYLAITKWTFITGKGCFQLLFEKL